MSSVWTDEQYLRELRIVPDITPEFEPHVAMSMPLGFEQGDGLNCFRGLLNALGIVGAAWAVVIAIYLLTRQ